MSSAAGLASDANMGRIFVSDEFGFSARIPAGLALCEATTASHVHGVGTVLVGADCENKRRLPGFNIWADYNSGFQKTAIEVLDGHAYCGGARPYWANDELARVIDGRRTAICRTSHSDGRIQIALAAQAGKWPDDDAEVGGPFINYTVNFGTTEKRFASDYGVLLAFLRSIRIAADPGR